jgi:hypothetical protein
VVAAGPLATALVGAGVGAATGGLIGALVGLGISKEDANAYAEGVRRGGSLVVVRSDDAMADRARDILALAWNMGRGRARRADHGKLISGNTLRSAMNRESVLGSGQLLELLPKIF